MQLVEWIYLVLYWLFKQEGVLVSSGFFYMFRIHLRFFPVTYQCRLADSHSKSLAPCSRWRDLPIMWYLYHRCTSRWTQVHFAVPRTVMCLLLWPGACHSPGNDKTVDPLSNSHPGGMWDFDSLAHDNPTDSRWGSSHRRRSFWLRISRWRAAPVSYRKPLKMNKKKSNFIKHKNSINCWIYQIINHSLHLLITFKKSIIVLFFYRFIKGKSSQTRPHQSINQVFKKWKSKFSDTASSINKSSDQKDENESSQTRPHQSINQSIKKMERISGKKFLTDAFWHWTAPCCRERAETLLVPNQREIRFTAVEHWFIIRRAVIQQCKRSIGQYFRHSAIDR